MPWEETLMQIHKLRVSKKRGFGIIEDKNMGFGFRRIKKFSLSLAKIRTQSIPKNIN
jgi:hypothetical protein